MASLLIVTRNTEIFIRGSWDIVSLVREADGMSFTQALAEHRRGNAAAGIESCELQEDSGAGFCSNHLGVASPVDPGHWLSHLRVECSLDRSSSAIGESVDLPRRVFGIQAVGQTAGFELAHDEPDIA